MTLTENRPATKEAAPVQQTGSKYFADTLKAYGLTHVFMVPTIAVEALAEMDRIGVLGISAHGEKAAAYMADGYARASNGPGVCLAQTIGSANLSAGLRDAYMAKSPVIAFTGGTAPMTRQKGVYQEIEDFPIYEQLTKYNMQIDDTRRLPDLLRQTFRAATTGAPGPAHLEFQGIIGTVLDGKFDVSPTDCTYQSEQRYTSLPPNRPGPEQADVDAAAAAIAAAERPVIIAGHGVHTSGAEAELLAFAEQAQVPIATSLSGKGVIDETGPYAVGVVGSSSRKSANQTVELSDLVVFLGTSVGSQVTDNWRLPAYGTPIIQIDIDPEQVGRNYPPIVGITADAKSALSALSAAYTTTPSDARKAWVAQAEAFVAAWREEDKHLLESNDNPIRPERLAKEITDFLPDDGVLVVDTGHAGIWTGSMIDLRPGQTLLRAMGSLGWSLPASIGAKAAVGDRTVVCFTGDGGFYYHLSEVETAVRHGLAPIIVVNNNVSLSQDMVIFQNSWGGADKISPIGDAMWRYTDVQIAEVAEKLGAWSVRVDDPADLAQALRDAQAAGRIAIVEVRTPAEALPAIPHGGKDFYAAAGDDE